jgi:hypothetical protein
MPERVKNKRFFTLSTSPFRVPDWSGLCLCWANRSTFFHGGAKENPALPR